MSVLKKFECNEVEEDSKEINKLIDEIDVALKKELAAYTGSIKTAKDAILSAYQITMKTEIYEAIMDRVEDVDLTPVEYIKGIHEMRNDSLLDQLYEHYIYGDEQLRPVIDRSISSFLESNFYEIDD